MSEDQERADRIRGYKEKAMEGPFIRKEWVCGHPAVDKFWMSGSTSETRTVCYLNGHFILHNGGRKDLLNYTSLDELLQDAEAYCQSLPKE